MTIQSLRFVLLCVCLGWSQIAPAIAETPSRPFSGTTLKLSHVVHELNGGDISDTVSVSVADNTRTTVKTAHGYVVAVTANAMRIRFTESQYWSGCGKFNGLVIEDITWPDTPARYMADATLDHKMASTPKTILTRQFNRVLLDFRGLKVKANDTLTLRITTGMLKQ